MTWPILVLYSLAAAGAVGVFLMLVAFVRIARQGGCQKAIQQMTVVGRWPLPRRLLLAGASLATLFFVGVIILRQGGESFWLIPNLATVLIVGVFILRMIAGAFSGSTPSAAGETSIDQTPPVISQPSEVRTRPRDGGQPTQ